MSFTIIIFVVLSGIIGWGISIYKSLVKKQEYCKESLNKINIQQVSCYDAIKVLVKLSGEASEVEYRKLSKIIEANSLPATQNPSAKEINDNENFLNSMLGKLFAVAEQYPELKSNESYINTMKSILEYEENIRLGRMGYNDSVNIYNNMVRMFPGNIMAKLFGFTVIKYLESNNSKMEYPNI